MQQRIQRKCGCQGTCGSCDSTKKVQRHARTESRAHDRIPDQVLGAAGTGGTPLDPSTRTFMESRFQHDFSRVRVHTGSRANEAASSIDAHAYTFGHDIVFGSGAYSPATDAGRRLLAHELTHVVQQDRGAALQMSSEISTPHDASEVEADRAADAVMSGSTPHIAAAPAAPFQRTVRQTVTTCNSRGAAACLVHLHPDEQNAYETAQTAFRERCTNLVTLGTGQSRCADVDFAVGGAARTCQFDPNRIFSSDAVTRRNAFDFCGCPADLQPHAIRAIRAWRETVLAPAIANCRDSVAGRGLSGPLPVIAFHNNTTPGALSIQSYQPGGSEQRATERASGPLTPAGATAPVANPAILAPTPSDTHDAQDPDNFLLVTRPADFHALRTSHNTVLQSQQPNDDGSLSVVLRTDRYANIEAEEKPFNATRYATNLAMANAVLDQFGVPRRPTALTTPCTNGAGIPDASQCPTQAATNGSAGSLMNSVMRFTRQYLSELAPPAMPREAPPATLREDCVTYADATSLFAAKAMWRLLINAAFIADPARVLNWIVGRSHPTFITPDPEARAIIQKDCMLDALRAASQRAGSSIVLPSGSLTPSAHRSSADQNTIWQRKWFFTGKPFDRISPEARAICGSLLLPTETQWNPAEPRHCSCWNPHVRTGASGPSCTPASGVPIPGRLNDDQKQMEILEASSAPGISRHHWGTDFDLIDAGMNPSDWEIGGAFADEYSWLRGNAGTYGFAQSFTSESGGHGTGYMEERWHWSYWPVAQALVEFVHDHLNAAGTGTSALETRLQQEWSTGPEFSYVRAHFREYMLNVNQQAPL